MPLLCISFDLRGGAFNQFAALWAGLALARDVGASHAVLPPRGYVRRTPGPGGGSGWRPVPLAAFWDLEYTVRYWSTRGLQVLQAHEAPALIASWRRYDVTLGPERGRPLVLLDGAEARRRLIEAGVPLTASGTTSPGIVVHLKNHLWRFPSGRSARHRRLAAVAVDSLRPARPLATTSRWLLTELEEHARSRGVPRRNVHGVHLRIEHDAGVLDPAVATPADRLGWYERALAALPQPCILFVAVGAVVDPSVWRAARQMLDGVFRGPRSAWYDRRALLRMATDSGAADWWALASGDGHDDLSAVIDAGVLARLPGSFVGFGPSSMSVVLASLRRRVHPERRRTDRLIRDQGEIARLLHTTLDVHPAPAAGRGLGFLS